MTQYFQCSLSQGETQTHAYIEERGAKVGSRVEIKEQGFDGLWTVTQVSDKGIEDFHLRDLQKMNRNSLGSILKK